MQALLGVLDTTTQRERDAARPPPLPPPPPAVAADFTARTQWRLLRVWASLHMPALQRLEMLVQFTEWGFSERVEGVLDAWERAAAAVACREDVLRDLEAVRPGPPHSFASPARNMHGCMCYEGVYSCGVAEFSCGSHGAPCLSGCVRDMHACTSSGTDGSGCAADQAGGREGDTQRGDTAWQLQQGEAAASRDGLGA